VSKYVSISFNGNKVKRLHALSRRSSAILPPVEVGLRAGGKPGDKKSRIAITYVVEKGKPLASPAPA